MISPFFPGFLAFLLLIACVALLVLLLRYRDRSVRLEAESRSWQERAEDRTQMLRRAEEVLKIPSPASARKFSGTRGNSF